MNLGHMPSCSLLSLPSTFFSPALEGLRPTFCRKLLPTEPLFQLHETRAWGDGLWTLSF